MGNVTPKTILTSKTSIIDLPSHSKYLFL
jgi:hypothetical protein